MQKALIEYPKTFLVGLTARTNNNDEMNPQTAKIGRLFNKYLQENIAEKITNRKNSDITIAAYTDFESDHNGNYTYFIGKEVHSIDNIAPHLKTHIIPASKYQKFTTNTGKMPMVVIDAWQQIWKMSTPDFGGNRSYQTDFEVYDQRALDINNAVIDIYIGLSNS